SLLEAPSTAGNETSPRHPSKSGSRTALETETVAADQVACPEDKSGGSIRTPAGPQVEGPAPSSCPRISTTADCSRHVSRPSNGSWGKFDGWLDKRPGNAVAKAVAVQGECRSFAVGYRVFRRLWCWWGHLW